MPLIRIEFDNSKVAQSEIEQLCSAIQKIVSEATEITDVFVYANSSQIKVQVAPVEIFIEMTATKISDPKNLTNSIKEKLSDWKDESKFQQPINLTLIPMNWVVEIGI